MRKHHTENHHAKVLLSVLKFPTLYYSKMKTQRFVFKQLLFFFYVFILRLSNTGLF